MRIPLKYIYLIAFITVAYIMLPVMNADYLYTIQDNSAFINGHTFMESIGPRHPLRLALPPARLRILDLLRKDTRSSLPAHPDGVSLPALHMGSASFDSSFQNQLESKGLHCLRLAFILVGHQPVVMAHIRMALQL